MNSISKRLLAVALTALTFFMSGCNERSSTDTTPTVKAAQDSSAQELEAPPVAPTI